MTRRLARAERIHAALLRAYPRSFRQIYQCELGQIFRAGYTAASVRGWTGRTRFWLFVVTDVVLNATRFRLGFRAASGGGVPVRRSARWRTGWMFRDVAMGFRLVRRQPGFSAVVIFTLAIGIGANIALFSVIHGVLLAPLPYADPSSLVRMWEYDLNQAGRNPMSPADFADYAEQNSTLLAVAGFNGATATLELDGDLERIAYQVFTPGMFDVLGVPALIGRTLQRGDEEGEAERIVLSHGLWQRGFGADSAVVGRRIAFSGNSYTVVGVMPPRFRPFAGAADVWVPWDLSTDRRRAVHFIHVLGRIAPGRTIDEVRADMRTLALRLEAAHPNVNTGHMVDVVSLDDAIVGDVRPALWLMAAGVGVVLLIACANLASLFLSRSVTRARELAVRAALGAGRTRIAEQLLTENLVLAGLGGAVGLVIASALVRAYLALDPGTLPRLDGVRMGLPTIGFGLGVSAVAGLLFGLVPAVFASRADLYRSLKEGGRISNGHATNRLRGGLVVVQMALAVTLLIGAGLLARSFERLLSIDPGFDPDGILTAQISLSPNSFPNPEAAVAFLSDMRDGLAADPAVRRAGTVTFLPFAGGGATAWLNIVGRPPWPDVPPEVNLINVSGDYFGAMGVRVMAGRVFENRDRMDAPRVVVVNDALAREYWPDEDPLGARIRLGPNPESQPYEIIGVVSDMRQHGFGADPVPAAFTAAAQGPWFDFRVVMDMRGTPRTGIEILRTVVHNLHDDIRPHGFATMSEVVGQTVARPRFGMVVAGLFAVIAMTIATVGVYGVVSYGVTQRAHEIGIRMALGASSRAVVLDVVRKSALLAAMAVAIGVVAAVAGTRIMEHLLFRVSATDPITFVAVSIVVSGVALVASYVPAARATRSDPVRVLRTE